jgi:DNA-directed RNA polymerase subunit M
VGDAVLRLGDDVAVPDRRLDEDLMTGRPQRHSKTKAAKKSERRKKFCPRCGSTEVQWARGLPQLWSIWECKQCGYRGAFIVEDSRLAEKVRERFLKTVKED